MLVVLKTHLYLLSVKPASLISELSTDVGHVQIVLRHRQVHRQ